MNWILVTILAIGLNAQAQQTADASAAVPAAVETSAAQAEDSLSVTSPEEAIAIQSQAQAEATAHMKNLKETEIPVQLEPAKKAAEQESPVARILMSLGIVAILGVGAFFFIRRYKYSNDPKSQATQIKILTQHYLGPKKSLAIVRVAGESMLIGITEQNINMIKSLSLLDEDIPEETPKEFHAVFNAKNAIVKLADDSEPKDDFSVSGIKDFVSSKLKNMRSLE